MPTSRTEITLSGVAHGGEAVGRDGGLVTFAALGLPGERVLLDVQERRSRFVRGRVAQVLEPSPERVTPPCPVFGTCGGCHWQHASYPAQLELKTAVLRDQLVRVARLPNPPIGPPVPSPAEWHYRNVVQAVPLRKDRDDGQQGPRLLCFRRARSHVPVAVEHCYIADPLINQVLEDGPWAVLSDDTWAALEGVILRAVPQQALQITLLSGRSMAAAESQAFVAEARARLPRLAGVLHAPARGGAARVVWGTGTLAYELGGARLEVPPDAFFQVNLGATSRLLDLLLEWLAPRPEDTVLDAYAGVGTFTIPLARRCRSVWAVESHRAAAAAITTNAAANGVTNVLADSRTLEAALAAGRPSPPGPLPHRGGGGAVARRRRAAAPRRTVPPLPIAHLRGPSERGPGGEGSAVSARGRPEVDLVVLDPPRQGCSPEAIAGVADLGPRRVAYVSCEPSTLARDLHLFHERGYRLARACVVDLFPQTYHLESLAILERL